MAISPECLIRKDIISNKNPQKAIKDILSIEDSNEQLTSLLALAYFENREYEKARLLYKKLKMSYQEGYCELLLGNDFNAAEIWFEAEDSPAVSWGRCLVNFVNLKVEYVPTFLQIRNFLEYDIGQLIRAQQFEFAENLISCNEVLANINLETYKFIGRALLHNGFVRQSKSYLMKSQSIIPNDPEVYYHLAQYHYQMNEYDEAKKMATKCLYLNANYTPARQLLLKIVGKLNLNQKQ